MNASMFLKVIQEVSAKVYNNSEPSDIEFGTVESIEPLVIRISEMIALNENQLILTNLVKDFEVDIEVSHRTVNDDILNTLHDHPGVPQNSFDSHHYHDYKGRKKIKIYMGLKVGEGVILLKKQGGQRRLVIDRIDAPITQGEWFE